MKKAIIIGSVVGIILGIGNLFTFGYFGTTFVSIFFYPLRYMLYFLGSNCSGEGCLGIVLLGDSAIIFFASLAVSVLIALNYKHFVQKQKNDKTKYVVISDIVLIILVLFSLFNYAKSKCLSTESCIVKVSSVYGSDSICEKISPNTMFTYDSENPESYNSYSLGKYACYSKMAVINKNESLCAKSPNKREQDMCYMQLSRVIPQVSLCQKINVGGYDENDPQTSGMNMFAQWDRDYCYKNVASQTRDVSKCELIQNNDNKQLCLAILNNDKKYCSNISKQLFMLSASAKVECENFFR